MMLNKYKAIAVVLAIGALLAGLILTAGTSQGKPDEHAHAGHSGEAAGKAAGKAASGHADEHADEHAGAQAAPPPEAKKGPHGGRLFTQGSFGLEVTIFETGVAPEFRLYTYQDGKALAPAASQLRLTLERLGRTAQEFSLVAENDYLKSSISVEEPHSFKVNIAANYQNQAYAFSYEQIEGRVSLSEAQLTQNGVELATAAAAKIQGALTLTGEIRLNADRMVQIVPRLTGQVETVLVNAGDKVQKGQVLAVISSQALAEQRSELLSTQKRHALAQSNFEREKKLWEGKISAEQDFLAARNLMQEAEISLQSARQKLQSLGTGTNTGGSLTRYEIRAPIAGTVIEKHLAMGQVLKDDTPIFVLADLSSVWVEMTVPAKDLPAVRTGQQAKVAASAFAAQAEGKLTYLGDLLGSQSRSAVARVVLPNPKGIWRPGLPVTVQLLAEAAEVPVAVSLEAIQSIKDSSNVMVRYGDQFEARPVQLGRSDGKLIEVLKGLEAGERYAAKNSFLIKAEIGKSGASHDH
jgi:cobalt-zinc-cadmium efflux system membrane fusion protein